MSAATTVPASIRVAQHNGELRELVLDAARLSAPAGDGRIRVAQGRLHWQPPAGGGSLRYQVELVHRRQGQHAPGYDAWLDSRYGIFRGEDAFPVHSWRRSKGSGLEGELAVNVPKGWSLVTPYLPDAAGDLPIRNPGARLPRPLGWIAAGDLGTRRDRIRGIEITVTAPRGLRMERVAMLGLLRWTLPELLPALGGAGVPRYISIVAAGKPLWLGALSAPNSIYVNAERPLISENGTSTVLHEMVHVLLADLKTPRDQDWIDEGLAEYLALRALRDSGTVSAQRFAATLAGFRRWGASAASLRTASATGPVTARAVVIFDELDAELRQARGGRETLAGLVRALRDAGGEADLAALRAASERRLGRPARALAVGNVPGFD